MNKIRSTVCFSLFLLALTTTAFAEKVKIGYDKSVDFSRYKTYMWTEPAMPPTRPMLYATVVTTIQDEFKSKGLLRTEKDGDLILIPAGGIEFGINSAVAAPILPTYAGQPISVNATMWTGAVGTENLTSPYVPQGSLRLQLVDRSTNKIVWNGMVSEKLDIEKKQESLDRIYKAIAKLIKQYPPKASSK
jgi:hypothetical protein